MRTSDRGGDLSVKQNPSLKTASPSWGVGAQVFGVSVAQPDGGRTSPRRLKPGF